MTAQKVLVTSELWLSCTGRSIADGFRAIGGDVSEVDSRYFVPVWRSLPLRLLARGTYPFTRREYLNAVHRVLDDVKPDLLVAIKGTHLDRGVFEACRRVGAASAIYYPDYHFDYAGVDLPALLAADHFFTTKSFQVDFLRAQPRRADIHFLHHGHGPSHTPVLDHVSESDFARDVAYVGTYTPDKERWLAEFRRLAPAATFEIFGEGWQQASDPAIRSILRGPRYAGAYAQTLQTSRINIALHMEPKGEHGWYDRVSIRTFEIPACKGFMLHIDNDEIRTVYDVPREVDVFATPAQLAEKVTYYLARPAARAAMVEAAYARCVPAYGYQARAETIQRVVKGDQSAG
jgi:spore maturation protein CgeB